MKKNELIKYWIDASEVDFSAMNNLYKSTDYVWALFLGHLVIEKLIKALVVKNNVQNIPKIHDLNKLVKLTDLQISDQISDDLDAITTFNIEARYPDYKKEFYKKCTKEFASTYNDKIIGIRKWLLEQLNK
jgi:HEPN domain-containing protein